MISAGTDDEPSRLFTRLLSCLCTRKSAIRRRNARHSYVNSISMLQIRFARSVIIISALARSDSVSMFEVIVTLHPRSSLIKKLVQFIALQMTYKSRD